MNGLVALDIVFHPPDNRKRDLDNLLCSCKNLFDGMAKAIELDDKNFRPITINFGEVIEGGKVKITLKPY